MLNIRVLAAGAVAGVQNTGLAAGLSPGSGGEADFLRAQKVNAALGSQEGTPAQTAIRFALMNPGVSGALGGFGQLDHIDEAVAAVDMGPLSDDVMKQLDALYASDFSTA